MWSFRKKKMSRYLDPRNVNFRAYRAEHEIVCNMLNQIARGNRQKCRSIVQWYGGSEDFADQFYDVCRKIIRNAD